VIFGDVVRKFTMKGLFCNWGMDVKWKSTESVESSVVLII
jgi:hypothetical protein